MSDPQSATLPPPATVPGGRSALVTVFLVVCIDLLGFGIVLPLLPRYANEYLTDLVPGGKDAPLAGVLIGLLMSSFSAMQFFFAPLWGRISDRIGRRPVLLLGLAGSVVFYLLFGYASSLGPTQAELAIVLLFVARIGQGIAGANIAAAQAVIADCTPPEKRKHGMALIGVAFGIGFTFGPLVGFFALTYFPESLGATGYAAALLSLLAFLFGLSRLPETRRPGEQTREWRLFDARGLVNTLRRPSVGPVVLTFFLATFGFGAFEATLALLNRDILGLEKDANNFLIFAYVGAVLMLTQGVLYRRLAARVSEATFMSVGIVLMALGVGALGVATWLAPGLDWNAKLGLILPALTASVVGFAFLTPSAQALVSRRSEDDRQGEILGANQAAAALARILGPFVGLTLYKLEPSHLLPYAFAAGLLLLMLPMIPRIRRG